MLIKSPFHSPLQLSGKSQIFVLCSRHGLQTLHLKNTWLLSRKSEWFSSIITNSLGIRWFIDSTGIHLKPVEELGLNIVNWMNKFSVMSQTFIVETGDFRLLCCSYSNPHLFHHLIESWEESTEMVIVISRYALERSMKASGIGTNLIPAKDLLTCNVEVTYSLAICPGVKDFRNSCKVHFNSQ